jgi:hypothetical protein
MEINGSVARVTKSTGAEPLAIPISTPTEPPLASGRRGNLVTW